MRRWLGYIMTAMVATVLLAQSPGPGCGIRQNLAADPIEKTIYYQLGEKQVPVRLIQFGERKDIFCINLHDNEFTSVEAARPVLQDRGGTLLKIDNGKERIIRFTYHGNNYAFDPNRMFSRIGIKESLQEQSQVNDDAITEIERFGARILSLIPENARYIIALHNNSDGGFSVNSYERGGEYYGDARKVSRNKNEDIDDLILTTNATLYKKISALGFNTILQDNANVTQDGSLSVWAGENRRVYLNIETEHGKVGKYREMLEIILKMLIDER